MGISIPSIVHSCGINSSHNLQDCDRRAISIGQSTWSMRFRVEFRVQCPEVPIDIQQGRVKALPCGASKLSAPSTIPQKENARGERAFSGYWPTWGIVGSSSIHARLWGAGKATREFAKLLSNH